MLFDSIKVPYSSSKTFQFCLDNVKLPVKTFKSNAAYLLVLRPIQGVALLGAVACHATRTTHQVTRLLKVGVVVATGAKPPLEPTPMRLDSRPGSRVLLALSPRFLAHPCSAFRRVASPPRRRAYCRQSPVDCRRALEARGANRPGWVIYLNYQP